MYIKQFPCMSRIKRILFLVAAAAFITTLAQAAEGPPIGGCPENFELVSVDELGIEDPQGLPSLDRNEDGFTCIMFLERHPLGDAVFVFRDNTVRHRRDG